MSDRINYDEMKRICDGPIVTTHVQADILEYKFTVAGITFKAQSSSNVEGLYGYKLDDEYDIKHVIEALRLIEERDGTTGTEAQQ